MPKRVVPPTDWANTSAGSENRITIVNHKKIFMPLPSLPAPSGAFQAATEPSMPEFEQSDNSCASGFSITVRLHRNIEDKYRGDRPTGNGDKMRSITRSGWPSKL